jgi:Concanavalin A-like lectin/glucanases superfamily
MGACLRASSCRARIALAALAVSCLGCSTRNLVAVDPYPCGDADPTGCAPGLLDDLIGFWRLDDAAGSATARDWSGWRNDGTLVDIDPASAWVASGPEGGSLSVEGRGYLNVPRSSSIDSIVTQVTLAAWMYLDGAIMDYATAISRQIGTGLEQHYHLSVNTKRQAILFITTPAGKAVLGGPATIPQQTWVHLAGTWDGSVARLYVDGSEVGNVPASGSFAADTNPVTVSGNGNGSAQTVSEFVPGRLADVMLYRRALRADEIVRIRNGALLASTGSLGDAGSP